MALLGLWLGPKPLRAANLDVSASYRMRAVSYSNLALNLESRNNHSFISNDARLGLAVRRIQLESGAGEETTMDLGLLLHALGATGSTSSLKTPLDRAANHYPSADFTPFIENAYVKINRLFGWPMETTLGRQSFRLGSGLVLDDDGAGITGVRVRGELPWWGMHLEGFIFHDRNSRFGGDNSLGLYGASLDLPGEGTWQLNQILERDLAQQPVFGCVNPRAASAGLPAECLVSKAHRSFTSLRYQLNYGPMVFDGEAAMQRGAATPTGLTPAPNHISYMGDAQVVRAKWKQRLAKFGEGIARVSAARGSGDNPATPTTDEAFFPSKGHRFQGLERHGFGDFFGATPYDAFGGNYSTSSASGLRQGSSGILVVGAGFTPPAYRGIALDIDYFLFQAERIRTGGRNLGMEWDFRLRYNISDQFSISAAAALFRAGSASNPARGESKKFTIEAYGRF